MRPFFVYVGIEMVEALSQLNLTCFAGGPGVTEIGTAVFSKLSLAVCLGTSGLTRYPCCSSPANLWLT